MTKHGRLIDAEWLKESLHNFFTGNFHQITEDGIMAYIDAAPTIEAKDADFCKDKLPKEEGWYLCATTVLTKARELYFYPSTGRWIDNIRKNMFDLYKIYGKVTGELVTEKNECVDWTDKVTAWMPLPAIPKKEEQDG